MNFRLRDKSKAKIRNYQINFAASLQIPSSNRKITDRNRPSNSPPPRSLRNNRHTIALSSPLLSSPLLSSPARPLLPVLSCPSSPARPLLPVLSCRPLRPVPDQTVFASEATTTHTPIRPALVLPSAPRGPFPKSNHVPASAPVGTASSRPASHPHETRSATPHHTTPHHTTHHTTRQVHRPHTTKYPRRKFRQGYPLYPKIVTWQRIHIKNVTAPVLPRGVRPGAVTNMLRTTKMRHHFHH